MLGSQASWLIPSYITQSKIEMFQSIRASIQMNRCFIKGQLKVCFFLTPPAIAIQLHSFLGNKVVYCACFFILKWWRALVSIPHWSIGVQFSLTHASQHDAVEVTSSACCSETPHVEKGRLFSWRPWDKLAFLERVMQLLIKWLITREHLISRTLFELFLYD